MIYPNNEIKSYWDGVITLVLIFSCMVTPYRLAFNKEDPYEWVVINIFIDIFFGIDIILSFISAYYTEEYELIESRRMIAKNYILGWFSIDVFAILPFDLIMAWVRGDKVEGPSSNVNDMIRLARLGRLYKVIRLLKILRILKLGKSS